MNRREALQQVAWLMGGTISAPAVLGMLSGCSAHSDPAWTPVFLTQEQAALVGDVAEIIIPRTDTPGAKDIGIPALIDRMLKDVYPKADQDRFIAGLSDFVSQTRHHYKRGFAQLDRDTQVATVRSATETAMAAERAHPGPERLPRPFMLMTRELTLLGYFTSLPGSSQVLQYNPVPGPYRGCVPLAQAGNGKSWATEQAQRF
ncbi:gluconate 2-dehydrogenase subunit 3 family protein [Povalibacter sp.]|uniref:gluconate 2-dehydrogenase subunit 3 family protein n=1 Tax=Povalibacter sp. TaxID=1962978 RepID=UPI002F3E91D2